MLYCNIGDQPDLWSGFLLIRGSYEIKKTVTIDEQIAKLKEHGMLIANDSHAKDVLSRINYYRLSGYALTFRELTDSNKYKFIGKDLLQSVMNLFQKLYKWY